MILFSFSGYFNVGFLKVNINWCSERFHDKKFSIRFKISKFYYYTLTYVSVLILVFQMSNVNTLKKKTAVKF